MTSSDGSALLDSIISKLFDADNIDNCIEADVSTSHCTVK